MTLQVKSGDLLQIIELGNSKNIAFEELCCQLVSLEKRPTGADFFRKGSSADAGVECFIRYDDNSETGWQAKFFSKFGDSQIQQLSKSISQALEKHPCLTKYAEHYGYTR